MYDFLKFNEIFMFLFEKIIKIYKIFNKIKYFSNLRERK